MGMSQPVFAKVTILQHGPGELEVSTSLYMTTKVFIHVGASQPVLAKVMVLQHGPGELEVCSYTTTKAASKTSPGSSRMTMVKSRTGECWPRSALYKITCLQNCNCTSTTLFSKLQLQHHIFTELQLEQHFFLPDMNETMPHFYQMSTAATPHFYQVSTAPPHIYYIPTAPSHVYQISTTCLSYFNCTIIFDQISTTCVSHSN